MKRAQMVVTLEESIKVASDVLGAEELTSLEVTNDDTSKIVPATMHFPLNTQDPTEKLSSPRLCFPELSNGQKWGIRRSAAVEELFSVLVAVDLPVEYEDDAHVFAMACVPRTRQLVNWIAVLTGQLIGTRHRPGLPPVDASYVKAALDSGDGVKPIEWITFSRSRPKKEASAHLKHFKHALDHLSRNELAPLPHTLLIDAQTEQYRGSYERAIMDAYVAAETALAQASGSAHKTYKYFRSKKWAELREKWPGLPVGCQKSGCVCELGRCIKVSP